MQSSERGQCRGLLLLPLWPDVCDWLHPRRPQTVGYGREPAAQWEGHPRPGSHLLQLCTSVWSGWVCLDKSQVHVHIFIHVPLSWAVSRHAAIKHVGLLQFSTSSQNKWRLKHARSGISTDYKTTTNKQACKGEITSMVLLGMLA